MSEYYSSGYYPGGYQQGYPESYPQGDSGAPNIYTQESFPPLTADPNFYAPTGVYGAPGPQQQGGGGSFGGGMMPVAPTPGSFYFHDEIMPETHGLPVSALAVDTAYHATYVASMTQTVSSTRWRSHRASILATHNSIDGMLYSTVAGHPEAPPTTLQSVYDCMFGISRVTPMPSGKQHIPPHAYRAPFGSSDVGGSMSIMSGAEKHGHLGISTLIPLDGFVASVSPSGVRLHTRGGVQVQDSEINGMLSGTIHPHSDQGPTHVSVGGVSTQMGTEGRHREEEVHCMDLWQGLRTISSCSFRDRYEKKVGVTALATSHSRGSVVAGCTDGHIRLLDGSLRVVATVKSHKGGVANMAISPDGLYIATCGYSSRLKDKESSVLYAFPDPTVFIYDIRQLGRSGIPHPFAGVRGCPQHLAFLPESSSSSSSKSRLLVGSGQAGGGFQVMVPFEAQDETTTSFIAPILEQSESVTAIHQASDDLLMGTSGGRVLRYKLAGQESNVKTRAKPATPWAPRGGSSPPSSRSEPKQKIQLDLPPYLPPTPPLSLDPKLLLNEAGSRFDGGVFTSYILQAEPKVSRCGDIAEDAALHFGPMGAKPLVFSCRRTISSSFLSMAEAAEAEYALTVPTSKLSVNILDDHSVVSHRYKGKRKEPKPNPNKFLYTNSLSGICYKGGGTKRQQGHHAKSGVSIEGIPSRYRLQNRPSFKRSGAFDPCDYNRSGLIPGWDYSQTLPNAFAPPVILMLYFLPEIRGNVLNAQCQEKSLLTKAYEKSLTPELGFIFHHIEYLASQGLLHPVKAGTDATRARIGAWIPSNFLTSLATMPEAEQLQILDGSPAAVTQPRRPEAFYRFLAYQLDKELSKGTKQKRMDSLHGIDFLSSNHFLSGSSSSSQSTTRGMTLDLCYDGFDKGSTKGGVSFGELLQHSLCRETRLRAWNSTSKAFETIVQRKTAVSMPEILVLSCSCAGRKEEEGLWVWRQDNGEPWLPENVEVELQEDGNVVVRVLDVGSSNEDSWTEYTKELPETVAQLVANTSTKGKHRYRLDAVLSFVRDEASSDEEEEHVGHHVLHARLSSSDKEHHLSSQVERASELLRSIEGSSLPSETIRVSPENLRKRLDCVETALSSLDQNQDSTWILYNGFAVVPTVVEDACAFHVPFKEPCLVVYRDVARTAMESISVVENNNLPSQVLNAKSMSPHASTLFDNNSLVPGKLLAFDAEFVSVQEEESTLTESGSKVVIRETRYAVGRISVVDCETKETIIDDHVLPREPVVDYLTRFSGLVEEDLDPTRATHSLISTRAAYLKLRYLVEQGCIFVGHGLRQDFSTVNLVVPPQQVIDTVEIYHQPGMRYISLRFLTNCVLGRDMQQDVHDSVEDAMAALELYEQAMTWKQEGVFDKKLNDIYARGQQTDWKLGVDV
eukprot:Nitzschia sp. Nitz4//scaffold106_size73319//39007//43304//NITZ4_005738-RA/size73319-augustus-gene-0.3-mRNA-1//1//CDS//3329532526//5438//frame0